MAKSLALCAFAALFLCSASAWNILSNNDVTEYRPQNYDEIRPQVANCESCLTALKVQNETAYRLEFIKQMARDAWNAFEEEHPDRTGMEYAITAVSALSTFRVLNLWEESVNVTHWLTVTKFNVSNVGGDLDSYHAVNHLAAGLLSVYTLTGHTFFLNKTIEVVDTLLPVYQSPTGLPYVTLNPSTGQGSGTKAWLFQSPPPQIIFQYLSDVTGDQKYAQISNRIRAFWANRLQSDPQTGVLQRVDIESGEWVDHSKALNWYSSTYYSYLLKAYIASNRRDNVSLELFQKALDSILPYEIIAPLERGVYLRQADTAARVVHNRMDSYACIFPAIWSLASQEIQQRWANSTSLSSPEAVVELNRAALYAQLAYGIERTCSDVANRTKTGLLLEDFSFNDRGEEKVGRQNRYRLTPELAETYLIMGRVTGQQIYREKAWELAQLIHQHARDPQTGAYRDIVDVNQVPTVRAPTMKPEFIGSTIKYLYLAQAHPSVIPLDQWVFTDFGHPMPICGQNVKYPQCNL